MIYNITLTYIDTTKELIPEHYITSINRNYKVSNVKELKKLITDLVDDNILTNQDWINESIKPVLTLLDKTYVSYNNLNAVPFYIAERYAEDKKQNCITIIKAEAYRITKEEAFNFLEITNV